MEPLLCFVSARNLGDAVFHAEFLKTLVSAGYADRVVVWTFPAARFLFEPIDRCEVVVSECLLFLEVRCCLGNPVNEVCCGGSGGMVLFFCFLARGSCYCVPWCPAYRPVCV